MPLATDDAGGIFMTADNQPTWMARRRWKDPEPAIDTSRVRRAQSTRLRKRLLTDGERTYTAYSVNELLEIESQSDRARPGHLFE